MEYQHFPYVWIDSAEGVVMDFYPLLKGLKLNSVVLAERSILQVENGITRIIFVHSAGVTCAVMAKLNIDQNFIVECFHKTKLSVNPLRSSLVPEHTLVSYSCKQTKILPKILAGDRIAKFCGFPVDSVINIKYRDYKNRIVKEEDRIVIKGSA